jgi:uncharacterized caspase-like protein
MSTEKHLTLKQKQAIELKEAHGKAVVLAVGIDKYDKRVGFPPLKTCSNDAEFLRDSFLDVHQLNTDPKRVFLLNSKTDPGPSKGEIIKAINHLVSVSQESDRLIFYYSGHGHRLKDNDGNEQFFIVPQDAWDCDDAEALLDFAKIRNIIERSETKQKIVILDACFSGPISEGKKFLPAKFSKKFLADYMQKTKGFAVISSSSKDAVSFTQSPNPKLSLFTFHLINALRGAPEALDESFLTLNSLYEYVSVKVKRDAKSYQLDQSPGIDVKSSGALIIGNFSTSIISPEQLDLEGFPISSLKFTDQEKIDVIEVLTLIFIQIKYP